MALLRWEMLHPRMTYEALGFLPFWLNDDDPRGACEQLDAGYQFGGFASNPITGFAAVREKCLKYPGDPLLVPTAKTQLRDETICFYPCEIVAVWHKDGTFRAARFD